MKAIHYEKIFEKLVQMSEIFFSAGPQHPGTGHFRMKVRLSGDIVLEIIPDPGYVHRGTEKLCESKDYVQNIPLVERVCLPDVSPAALGFVLAIEKLLKIDPPQTAQYIRVIYAEMNRIMSHLYWLAIYGIFLGHSTMFMWPFGDRELFIELAEEISGARMTYSDILPGGVRNTLPEKFVARLNKAINRFLHRLPDYERIFFKNPIFKQRSKETGILSRNDAIRLGATGPVLRASGVNYDIRKINPYAAYADLDFEPAVFDEGDCYSRAMVRLEEMRTSCSILKQAVDHIPSREVQIKVPTRVPSGYSYARVEAARGELGYYVQSDGSNKPNRVKISTPSFRNLSILGFLIRNCVLADVPTIYWSLDYWAPDSDR